MTFIGNPADSQPCCMYSRQSWDSSLWAPEKLIVHGNTAATVNNIAAVEMLFRFGIAGQLIGQTAFIFVALALYKLLDGVNRRHAFGYGTSRAVAVDR